MKATEIKLIDFLKKSPQFVIPIYQRTYSWHKDQCNQLWLDILKAGKNKDINGHFIGSIVYVEKGLFSVSNQNQLLVIDGQQRLTTITLLIEALARKLGSNSNVGDYTERKLRDYYLVDPREHGDSKYKLLLSQTDKDTLISLLDQREMPKDYSIRINENFKFFLEKLSSDENVLQIVLKGLLKLIVVDISLDRDNDNPQLIFESLNSTGLELSQADLIRNYILMGLDTELQSKLYLNYWRTMELDFGQEGYVSHFDSFMKHYLTVKSGSIPKEREVYSVFKKQFAANMNNDVENVIKDISKFSKYYCSMALNAEENKDLKWAFNDLKDLKVDVAFPFLLELYDDFNNEILSKDDFLKIVRLIESYVFRRAICGIPTNSMNKTFGTFSKKIDKENYVESVLANFLLLTSYRRFPDDEEFKRELILKDVYNFRNKVYWLRRIENFERKERVLVNEFTIEHVMPQNEDLSNEWKNSLGKEWKRIHDTYLHTIGNLTLTGYNSEYSDKPFIEKRNMKGGFSDSPLILNKEIANKESWSEQEIKDRANSLSKLAIKVWQAPLLDESILKNYKPKNIKSKYSIDNFKFLQNDHMGILYDNLRKQILALDPSITETFLKLYIAYKAETNFVDIVPQSKKLKLSLNIPFSDIDDPKEICRDVSDLGRLGNGDVEVIISKSDEIPYAIGLIRQAFERQMA